MRRKSERNKSKPSDKKPEVSPKKTRRLTRRNKRSVSHSSSDDSDDVPLKSSVEKIEIGENAPVEEPKKVSSHSNSDDENEQPIWKVKTSDASSGEIQKLKICLQRPSTTPERTDKSPRTRRGKTSSQSDEASLTPDEKSHKRRHRRSSTSVNTSEGSSLDNTAIEAAEKDESATVLKETTEIIVGKGKLDSSQTSQAFENQEYVQDSQIVEIPGESRLETELDKKQSNVDKEVSKENANKLVEVSIENENKQIEMTTENVNKQVEEPKENETMEAEVPEENKTEQVQISNENENKEVEVVIERETKQVEILNEEEKKLDKSVNEKNEENSNTQDEQCKEDKIADSKDSGDTESENQNETTSNTLNELKENMSNKNSVSEALNNEKPQTLSLDEKSEECNQEKVILTEDKNDKLEVNTEHSEATAPEESTKIETNIEDSSKNEEMVTQDNSSQNADKTKEIQEVNKEELNDEKNISALVNNDSEDAQKSSEDSDSKSLVQTPETVLETKINSSDKDSTEILENKSTEQETCTETDESAMDTTANDVTNNEDTNEESKNDASSNENSLIEKPQKSPINEPMEIDSNLNSTIESKVSLEQSSEIENEDKLINKNIRKRKWGKCRVSLQNEDRITSNSIVSFCPSLKFLSIEELKLETEEIKDHDIKIRKKDKNKEFKLEDKDVAQVKSPKQQEDDIEKDISNIGLNRKISIVNDEASKLQPPPSPAKNSLSNILYITNLVRPFTLKQLQELLSRTGKISDDGFWTDKIKSKCYVQYETEEEAENTRNALHGVQWPTGNGKKLIIDYGTIESMEAARNAIVETPTAAAKTTPETNPEKIPLYVKKELLENENQQEKQRTNAPIREWDLGKVPQDYRDRSRSREKNNARSNKDKDREDKKRHSRNQSPTNGDQISSRKKKKEEQTEVKLMDDLFHKTKATPSIYWLPLSPEQIAKKQQQRLQRMAEHKRRMEESRRFDRDRDFGRGGIRPRKRSARYDGD